MREASCDTHDKKCVTHDAAIFGQISSRVHFSSKIGSVVVGSCFLKATNALPFLSSRGKH